MPTNRISYTHQLIRRRLTRKSDWHRSGVCGCCCCFCCFLAAAGSAADRKRLIRSRYMPPPHHNPKRIPPRLSVAVVWSISTENESAWCIYYYAISQRMQGIGFTDKNYPKCVLHLETDPRWKRRTSTIRYRTWPVSRVRVDVSNFVNPKITGTCIVLAVLYSNYNLVFIVYITNAFINIIYNHQWRTHEGRRIRVCSISPKKFMDV